MINRKEAKHREIYKAHYGQNSIKPWHVIHHLDHDPTNNDIQNLAQMSMGDHAKLHKTKHISPKYVNGQQVGLRVDNRTNNDDRSKIIWFGFESKPDFF